jgi:thiol-disulfide isomerase/thioredoxin
MKQTLALLITIILVASILASPEKAPDFASDAVWIDAGDKAPRSIKGYRGRVLLVDFWEYTCINCIRDFAVVKRWYQKYHPYGFDVVGVHYGEFPMGFSAENVREAAKRFQFPWPVVADLNGSIWNAYRAKAWPTRYLIDPNGEIVMQVEGEVNNDVIEANIRIMLSATRPEVKTIPPDQPDNASAPQCGATTDEMYVGNWRGSGRGAVENSQGYHDGVDTNFRADREPNDGRVMLSGKWRTDKDGVISAGKQVTAATRYHARSVYAVLSVQNPKKTVRLSLMQDGKPLSQDEAGVDVQFDSQGSYIEVSQPRMYYLVKNRELGSHLLALEAQDKNLALHTLTFGNNCQQNFEQK